MKKSDLFCRTAAVFIILQLAVPVVAADPDPAVQAANNAKMIAEAERDAANARLEKAKAEAEIASVEQRAAADIAKAVADAEAAAHGKEEAAAKARAAAIAAEQAEVKARFGNISANSVTPGAVDLGNGAGTSEATVLATRALDALALDVANGLDQDVIVIAGNSPPQLGNLSLYNFRRKLADTLFMNANQSSQAAEDALAAFENENPAISAAGANESIGAVITGAGAALDAASKIASFFKTDYKFENLQVTGLTDEVLAVAVAGHLARKGKTAYLAGRTPGGSDAEAIFTELKSLIEDRIKSDQRRAAGEAALLKLEAMLKAAKSDSVKTRINAVIDAFTRSIAAEKAASDGFDAFIASLGATEGNRSMIQRISEERALERLMAKDHNRLFVSVTAQGGSGYTRKNIWNFLGAQPFFVSGSVVANWTLVDKHGKVIKSGVATGHSGYRSVGRIAPR